VKDMEEEEEMPPVIEVAQEVSESSEEFVPE